MKPDKSQIEWQLALLEIVLELSSGLQAWCSIDAPVFYLPTREDQRDSVE